MKQRGRKSALAVIPTEIRGITRLPPPPMLKHAAERAVWLAAVNARPASWFGPEHVPLLVNYCRHVVGADVVAGVLDRVSPESLEDEAGLARYERLRKLLREETRALRGLATSMRLTHQALYIGKSAGTAVEQQAGRRPWESE